MKRTPAFWDSSALVPLCVREVATGPAQAQLRKFGPVVWWATLIEIHSAISRLRHAGKINDAQKQSALRRLMVLAQSWKEILPEDQLRDLATRILDLYALRAANSLQLAAALTWCKQRPARRIFICADERLAEAAEAAGFSVVQV